jgi:hypothetical protein
MSHCIDGLTRPAPTRRAAGHGSSRIRYKVNTLIVQACSRKTDALLEAQSFKCAHGL